MCVTIYGKFCSDGGVVTGYDNRIRAKYTAKWGVQIAGMIFQTRFNSESVQIPVRSVPGSGGLRICLLVSEIY